MLSILILAATGFFLLKIVSAALSIEKAVRDLADEIKSKVTAFSITFAGLVTLLEKLIQYRKDFFGKDDDKDQKEDQEAGDIKKGPKKIKIAKLDEE